MQQIVFAESIFQDELFSGGSRGGESDGGVGLLRGSEIEIGRVDESVFRGEGVTQSLVLTAEEGDIRTIVAILEAFDDGFLYDGSFTGQLELQFTIPKRHFLLRTVEGGVKKGRRVGHGGLQSSGFSGFVLYLFLLGFCLCFLFELFRLLLPGQFFFRGLVPKAESYEYGGNQHEADNCIFIHLCCVMLWIC